MAKSNIQIGILLVTLGMLIIPGIDAFAKYLSGSLAAGQISWSRFLLQTLFMLPLVLALKKRSLRSLIVCPTWGFQAARGFCLALATVFFFAGLYALPLADAIAIFFVEPMLLTLLSVIFLKETIGWRRIAAILVGFMGALLVIQPSYKIFGFYALMPLGAAFCFAFYLLFTRVLASKDDEDPLSMQFYAGFFGFVILSIFALISAILGDSHVIAQTFMLQWPTWQECMMLLGLGFVATLGHTLVVYGFQRASASVLAPFQYMEIISATLLGYIFFNDFPDLLTWLGIGIIVLSGVYIYYRESVNS